jgi:CRP/FNR family transcriptional regulator, cyclic AMP receptor protein
MVMVKKAKSKFDAKVFLATVDGGLTKSNYRKGQTIFKQGDPSDAVFYIEKGKVKVTVISEQGKEAVIAFLQEGDFLGEACLRGQPLRIATATAMVESLVAHVEKPTFLKTLREEPKFSELFTSYLLARTVRVEEDLVDQLFNSSEKRLARALLILSNVGKAGRPEAIIPRVDQATLAEMIGTTRSRVSQFMNKFRQMGLIEYNGDLKIHTSLLDVVLHERAPHIKAPK